ncbi:MAG: hypothetical protein OXT67_12640 [Zetaproteobacteria bacterium]|nr:hypothetical protein [Zetaproteobacteria bacterium]
MTFQYPVRAVRAFILIWSMQAVNATEMFAHPLTPLEAPGLLLLGEGGTEGALEEHYAQKKQKKKKKRKKRRGKKSKKKRRKRKSAAKPNALMYALPLGVGQFYNGSPVLGAAFATAQLGGLALGIMSSNSAATLSDDLVTFIEQRNAEITTLPSDEQQAHENETRAYKATQDQEIQAQESMATVGFLVSFLGYAGSVAHAFLAGPNKVRPRKKSRSEILRFEPGLWDIDQEPILYSLHSDGRLETDTDLWSMLEVSREWHVDPIWTPKQVGFIFHHQL